MKTELRKLVIIGSGELGIQILHLALQSDEFQVVGFVDDFLPIGTLINDFKVIGSVNDVFSLYAENKLDCLVVAIGYKHMDFRKEVFERFNNQIPFATIIHKTCFVDPTSRIGDGVVLYPGCIIDKNVVIEQNVLINLGVIISHDSRLKSHSFISPAVSISGFCVVGQCCKLGTNTTLIDNLTIADNVTTGGGTVVIKNPEKSGLYVGNPARFVR